MIIGTLFSGIGSAEQAIKRVYPDAQTIFACEWDKYARQSYQANYEIDDAHFHADINDMDGKPYRGKVDVIVGGSPCQDFSIAGLREGVEGKRGQLIWQYFRIIDEVRPRYFVYENVKGMVSDKGGQTLKDFLSVFRDIGYNCHYEVLNSKDYGIPQNRERIFIVGFLDMDEYYRFQFAPKIPLTKKLRDVLESEVDEKYYLNKPFTEYNKQSQGNALHDTAKEAPAICAGTHGYAMGYIQESMIERWANKKVGSTLDNIAPTIKAICANKNIRQSPNVIEPKILQLPRGKNNGGEHEVCPTISSSCFEHNNLLQDSYRIRKLIPRECLRLQDFPDTFRQVVSDSQMYKQTGNSKTVAVVEMIFRQIEKAKEQDSYSLFGAVA